MPTKLAMCTTQYENQLIEFHQILYLPSSWQDLAWDCYTSFFFIFVSVLWSFICTKILFPLISLEPIDRISPNFIYAFILARSIMGLLHFIHFSHFCTRVMALYLRQNFVSTQYPENKLTEIHHILYMH